MKLRLLCLCFIALSLLEQDRVAFGQEVKRASTHGAGPQSLPTNGALVIGAPTQPPIRSLDTRSAYPVAHPE